MNAHDITRRLLALDAATFQQLGDRLLPRISDEYGQLEPYGRRLDSRKTRRGKPDSHVPRADGTFVAIEYTTDQNATDRKVMADLTELADPSKCTIADDIGKVVIVVSGQLKPETFKAIQEECGKHSWEFEVFSLNRLVKECERHMSVVGDLLGIPSTPGELGPDLVVDLRWVEVSGFRETKETEGYSLRWSREERIQTRLTQGYEVAYQIDDDRTRHRIKAGDVVLLLKRSEEDLPNRT